MPLDISSIKTILEKEQCDLHHEMPAIRIVNGYIEIAACCEHFHEKLENMMDEIAMRTTDNYAKA